MNININPTIKTVDSMNMPVNTIVWPTNDIKNHNDKDIPGGFSY